MAVLGDGMRCRGVEDLVLAAGDGQRAADLIGGLLAALTPAGEPARSSPRPATAQPALPHEGPGQDAALCGRRLGLLPLLRTLVADGGRVIECLLEPGHLEPGIAQHPRPPCPAGRCPGSRRSAGWRTDRADARTRPALPLGRCASRQRRPRPRGPRRGRHRRFPGDDRVLVVAGVTDQRPARPRRRPEEGGQGCRAAQRLGDDRLSEQAGQRLTRPCPSRMTLLCPRRRCALGDPFRTRLLRRPSGLARQPRRRRNESPRHRPAR